MLKHIFIIFFILLPFFVLSDDFENQQFIERQSLLASNPNLILLRAMVIDPLSENISEEQFGLTSFRDKTSGDILYVIQFWDVPSDEDREEIFKEGGKIISYIPNNAYLVIIDSEKFQNLSYKKNVRSAFRLPKWAKIDPNIYEIKGDELELSVNPISGFNSLGIADFLVKTMPEVKIKTRREHHENGPLVCSVPASILNKFLDSITGVEEVFSTTPYLEPKITNDNSIWVIQNYDTTNKTNYNLSATIWNKGIIGTGQIGALLDTGLTNTSCQFRYNGTSGSQAIAQSPTPPNTGTISMNKKVIAYYLLPDAVAYDSANSSFHGSHTSGTIAGDNYLTLSTPTSHGHDSGDGMAPNAKLIMQDCGDANGNIPCVDYNIQNYYRQAYNAGARIHSNSWAASGFGANAYLRWTEQIDEVAYEKETLLMVCAQNNAGCNPGSMGSPASAKNVISIGASTSGQLYDGSGLAYFSGRGPTADGRLKPDIVAPGGDSYSCSNPINSADGGANGNPPCGTRGNCGTSMAAPTVAGGLLLARQYFNDGWYPSGTKVSEDTIEPSAALLKALLINGAVPLEGIDLCTSQNVEPIPNMKQGWGRIHLDNALYFSGDNRRLRVWDVRNANGLKTGEFIEYYLYVSSNSVPLKVHLVWTEPQSNALALINLINNLDLEVISPSGTLYKGNVFSNGQSTTGGSADVLNNVEGFVLNNPEVGTWKLRVKGAAIPGNGVSNRQGYALVATYPACSSSLSAPTNLNAVDNGTTGINLYWDAVSGAQGYLIYRASGANPSAEQFTLIGQSPTTVYLDTDVQGGFTYSYKVRATDNCAESGISSKATTTYTGNCTLLPTFQGLVSVSNDTSTPYCDLVLTWQEATSNCPLAQNITYHIYRSTSPYFTPNSSNLIAYGITGTTYRDYQVEGLKTYYYIVKAEDSTTENEGPNNSGNVDNNNVVLFGTPWSSSTVFGNFTDDGGDTNAKLTLPASWRVANLQNHTTGGLYSYHNTLDGQNYLAGMCSAATSPRITLGTGSSLSYWVRYNIEYQWDGVVVEISINGGSSWTPITPIGGYPSSFSQTQNPPLNACGYPYTQGCFNGPSANNGLTDWAQYTHNLSSYSGQEVMIRWRFSSDEYFQYEGFYLDDITITNANINQPCLPLDGIVQLDRASYPCQGSVEITVIDGDLVGNGTQSVNIKSTTEPSGEIVTLIETPPSSGIFKGTIPLTTSPPPSSGQLSISHNDTITVTYIDANDGHGGTNVSKTKTANVDCVFPVISNVQVINVTANSATITWTTDELADSLVIYGTSKPPTSNFQENVYVTEHSITLTNLDICTTYFFSVSSKDPAGNTTIDNNGGNYYSFKTNGYIALISDDVETDPGIWTITSSDSSVQWHRSTCRSHSGNYSWKAGMVSCTENIPTPLTLRTSLRSNPINLGPPGHNFHLRYWQWYYTEQTWDTLRTLISTDGGVTWIQIEDDLAYNQMVWHEKDYDLSEYSGEVLIRFDYVVAVLWNNYEGWYLDDIRVEDDNMACGTNLIFKSYIIDDSCTGSGSGGGNGISDPGEEVILNITIENIGIENATNITGTISTSYQGINIITPTANFPNIPSWQNGTSQSPHFKIGISPDIPCYTEIPFNLHITSNENPSGTDSTFIVNAGREEKEVIVFQEDFWWSMFPPALPPGWTTVAVQGVPWEGRYGCYDYGPSLWGDGQVPANAWLFSPGIELEAGITYTLDFSTYTQWVDEPYNLAIWAGTAPNISSQTIPIYSGVVATSGGDCSYRNGSFSVPTNGTYYLGFHGWANHLNPQLVVDDLFLYYTLPSSCNQCTPICTAPGAATLLSVNGTCDGNVLSFQPGSGTTQSYNIYRKEGSCGGTYTKIAGPVVGTSFIDTTANGGTNYAYVIRGACDLFGYNESPESNCISATRPIIPTPTISGSNQNTCPSTSVILSTQTGKSNYKWYKNGQLISGANSSNYEVTSSGNYTVSYTDTNGCTGTSVSHFVEIVPCVIDIKYHYRGSFTEITGDGDSNFERGEKFQVTVYLKNFGNSPATNVSATLTGNGIILCGGTKNFGNIGAGESKSATFEFVISQSFSPCGGPIYFNIINKNCAEITPAGTNEYYVFGISNVGEYVAPTPQELVLTPSNMDSWIDQNNQSYNGGSDTTMSVQNRNNQARRSLIYFDISSIPENATINSATLELYATAVPSSSQLLDIYRITQSWTENGVNWSNQPTYTTPIVQIDGGTSAGWKIWNVKSIVESWHNGSYTNYGFLLKCNVENSNQTRLYQFATKENSTQSYRPILRINYTVPGSFDCSYTGSGSCGVMPPPPVANGVGSTIPVKITKVGGSPTNLHITWDSSTCNSDHAVLLYGNLGTWNSYAGAVTGCNVGSNGATGADFELNNTNVWLNLIWVNSDGVGGYPGVNSQGQKRNLNAAGLCGVTSENHDDNMCD